MTPLEDAIRDVELVADRVKADIGPACDFLAALSFADDEAQMDAVYALLVLQDTIEQLDDLIVELRHRAWLDGLTVGGAR